MGLGGPFSLGSCVALLRPVARFFLRQGFTIQDFIEVGKRAFVQAAEEELEKSDQKAAISRLVACTGIHKAEIKRLLSESPLKSDRSADPRACILARWEQDPDYADPGGQPRVLNCDTADSDFHRLVRLEHSHLMPGTLLAELERCGAVERVEGGVRLSRATNVLRQEPEKLMQMVGRDFEILLKNAGENITAGDDPHMHLLTEYDNVYQNSLPRIKRWLVKEGRAFHKRCRDFLAAHDADLSRSGKRKGESAGGAVAVGSFAFSFAPAEEVSAAPSDQ